MKTLLHLEGSEVKAVVATEYKEFSKNPDHNLAVTVKGKILITAASLAQIGRYYIDTIKVEYLMKEGEGFDKNLFIDLYRQSGEEDQNILERMELVKKEGSTLKSGIKP